MCCQGLLLSPASTISSFSRWNSSCPSVRKCEIWPAEMRIPMLANHSPIFGSVMWHKCENITQRVLTFGPYTVAVAGRQRRQIRLTRRHRVVLLPQKFHVVSGDPQLLHHL